MTEVVEFEARDSHGGTHKVRVDAADWPLVSKHKWHIQRSGYVVAYTSKRVPGKKHPKNLKIYLTALLFGFKPGERGRTTSERLEVDHIDEDKLRNTRDNLRVVSHALNMSHWAAGGLYWDRDEDDK